MPKYVAKMALPESVTEIFNSINGVAVVINRDSFIDSQVIEIEFEAEDLYDLATTVHNLQDELNSILGYMSVNITKPVEA